MVEAAGIEPASAWRPVDASTCVGAVRSRRGLSQRREKPRPGRRFSHSRLGLPAVGSQPPDDARYPPGGVADGRRCSRVQLGSESVVVVGSYQLPTRHLFNEECDDLGTQRPPSTTRRSRSPPNKKRLAIPMPSGNRPSPAVPPDKRSAHRGASERSQPSLAMRLSTAASSRGRETMASCPASSSCTRHPGPALRANASCCAGERVWSRSSFT